MTSTAPVRGHAYSHSQTQATLPSTHAPTAQPRTAGVEGRYRASVDTGGAQGGARGWGSSVAASPRGPRPASEVAGGGTGAAQYASPETEAIDRWFEDLQHYEATLEEMAAASLDANFKEELSAIEQWFRVLSEAERTAALYSLLQSSTQVQMRFFVTVLQQMARADPMSALLSPAHPGQLSMEAQMEAKLFSMGLKSPASPAVREYARQSLSASASASLSSHETYLSPHSAAATAPAYPVSPTSAIDTTDEAAATKLANERAKLKANARISAPASMLSGANGGGETLRSALWSERERVVEGRSPSPRTVSGGASGRSLERPKSTGSAGEAQPNGSYAGLHLSQSTGPPSASSFLRSPAPYLNPPVSSTATNDLDNQLSPLVGGNWASMVNTPLIPMFAKSSTTIGGAGAGGMEQGNFGGLSSPGATLDGTSARLGSQWGTEQAGVGGIVLDDVRKFRRSAKIGGGSVEGGALGGMYERGASGGQLNSMQQNAINLGLVGLQQQQQQQQQQHLRETRSGATSPGGSLSAQQAAVAAQQNWRNGLGSPSSFVTSNRDEMDPFSTLSPNVYHHSPSSGSPSAQAQAQAQANANANAQLASLFALQQQMLQQQQQMQQLNMAAAAGMQLTPVQLMGLQQSQQQGMSPGGRMGGMSMGGMGGMSGMGMMGMGGMGMMGMASPRGSPRNRLDRSPGGNSTSKSNLPSSTGSGSNPDEPIDMHLLEDVPAWLRSLRLHKYTTNFEKSHWKEMVLLDEKGLEGMGVNALGARRKLLKVFETVRGKMGMALPGDGAMGTHDTGSNRSGSPTGSAAGDV